MTQIDEPINRQDRYQIRQIELLEEILKALQPKSVDIVNTEIHSMLTQVEQPTRTRKKTTE